MNVIRLIKQFHVNIIQLGISVAWLVIVYRAFFLMNHPYVHPYYDPTMPYVYSALSSVETNQDLFMGHPGLLVKKTLKAVMAATGEREPEVIIEKTKVLLFLIIALIAIGSALTLYFPIFAAIFLFSRFVVQEIAIVRPEFFLYLLAFILILVHQKADSEKRNNSLIFILSASVLLAFGIMTKFSFVAFVPFLLFFYNTRDRLFLVGFVLIFCIVLDVGFSNKSLIRLIEISVETTTNSHSYGAGVPFVWRLDVLLKGLMQLAKDPIYLLLLVFLTALLLLQRKFLYFICFVLFALVYLKSGVGRYFYPLAVGILILGFESRQNLQKWYQKFPYAFLLLIGVSVGLTQGRVESSIQRTTSELAQLEKAAYRDSTIVITGFPASGKETAHFFGSFWNQFSIKLNRAPENVYFYARFNLNPDLSFDFSQGVFFDANYKRIDTLYIPKNITLRTNGNVSKLSTLPLVKY